jgi:hypothetical protein
MSANARFGEIKISTGRRKPSHGGRGADGAGVGEGFTGSVLRAAVAAYFAATSE